MSMRNKSMLVIVVIVLVTTFFNFSTSMFLTRQGLEETIEKDLALSRDLADTLVTKQIDLLVSDAHIISERIEKAQTPEEMKAVMVEEFPHYEDFIAASVFDREHLVATYGKAYVPEEWLSKSTYIKAAFEGEANISSTRRSSLSGLLVMHICVPMGDSYVLSVSVDGHTFSKLLKPFRLWETGNIFLLDEEGTVIANVRDEWVEQRVNFVLPDNPGITSRPNYPDIDKLSAFTKRMIETGEGFGTYSLDGVDRMCVYETVSSPAVNWRIGVVAPLTESPVTGMQNGLILSSALFVLVGAFFAIIVSGLVSRPYYRIKEQAENLEELNRVAREASE
ncbi:MAG: hypothetical protein LBD25_01605, partial [Coriobacteriales bacterium]|nr:hypothetical protein [Coriobacteriales bacterium]